jgi:hypothetical protein
MVHEYLKLMDVARRLDVEYRKLRYRIISSTTPVPRKHRYSDDDIEVLKLWLPTQKSFPAFKEV